MALRDRRLRWRLQCRSRLVGCRQDCRAQPSASDADQTEIIVPYPVDGGGRYYASYAALSWARSSFFIFIIACVIRLTRLASELAISSVNSSGTTCHDRPYLSLSHPHGPSSPFVSASQL